jgi:hypothetical protein
MGSVDGGRIGGHESHPEPKRVVQWRTEARIVVEAVGAVGPHQVAGSWQALQALHLGRDVVFGDRVGRSCAGVESQPGSVAHSSGHSSMNLTPAVGGPQTGRARRGAHRRGCRGHELAAEERAVGQGRDLHGRAASSCGMGSLISRRSSIAGGSVVLRSWILAGSLGHVRVEALGLELLDVAVVEELGRAGRCGSRQLLGDGVQHRLHAAGRRDHIDRHLLGG